MFPHTIQQLSDDILPHQILVYSSALLTNTYPSILMHMYIICFNSSTSTPHKSIQYACHAAQRQPTGVGGTISRRVCWVWSSHHIWDMSRQIDRRRLKHVHQDGVKNMAQVCESWQVNGINVFLWKPVWDFRSNLGLFLFYGKHY